MPITVQEVLRQSGFTDEQIAAIDAKQITAFTGVLTTAEREREAAEVAQRSNAKFYDETIAPALNNWGSEKANLEAQTAFYRAQNEAARNAGFVPTEAPSFQARDGAGRYVAGAAGGVPGSPTFTMEDIDQRLGTGLGNMGWAFQEYSRAYPGQFLPDPVDKLAAEASNSRMPFRDYVGRKYDFAGRQAEQQRKQQEEHDGQIRRETEAKVNREWAEKTGSNPDVRIPQASRFAEVTRAVKANERPDPLALNEAQRRQATSQSIRKEINSRADEVA